MEFKIQMLYIVIRDLLSRQIKQNRMSSPRNGQCMFVYIHRNTISLVSVLRANLYWGIYKKTADNTLKSEFHDVPLKVFATF